MAPFQKTAPRINNVQALRGFAAVLVVYGHTGFSVGGLHSFGTFGVDIFFVISGFIMAMIVDRNPEKFFLRRLIRIVPLYWTATLGVFALAAWRPEWMLHTRADFRELLESLFFIPFYKNGERSVNPVLFVGWTLNYEMFFYVVLALCLRGGRRHATALACGALFVLMLVSRLFLTGHAAGDLYGAPIVMEFVLGMAAYWLVRRMSISQAERLRWPAVALVMGAALLMISFQATRWWPAWQVDRLYLFGLPSFFMIASAALLSKSGWDTKSRSLVLVGDASYVIYILHSYILDGFNRVLTRRLPGLAIDRAGGCVVSIALVVALSVVLYLKAERPVVDWLSVKLGTRRIKRAEVADPAESMA